MPVCGEGAPCGALPSDQTAWPLRRTGLQSEEIVAELVYSFLIPEVQKSAVRSRGGEDQPAGPHSGSATHHPWALESSYSAPAGVPEATHPTGPSGDSSLQGDSQPQS
ncbi:hypothetical protein AAFF_G00132890 [Aldrovandia affinis]|uniref:Uncharacterized protein n=1 Tax=Aldrovandia affinis TaxID=143900 RepID=A0AAD7W9N6_9TELE|nr:hypothetical protein AAFF_G00132890 [Aldrovandia affinis]